MCKIPSTHQQNTMRICKKNHWKTIGKLSKIMQKSFKIHWKSHSKTIGKMQQSRNNHAKITQKIMQNSRKNSKTGVSRMTGVSPDRLGPEVSQTRAVTRPRPRGGRCCSAAGGSEVSRHCSPKGRHLARAGQGQEAEPQGGTAGRNSSNAEQGGTKTSSEQSGILFFARLEWFLHIFCIIFQWFFFVIFE